MWIPSELLPIEERMALERRRSAVHDTAEKLIMICTDTNGFQSEVSVAG